MSFNLTKLLPRMPIEIKADVLRDMGTKVFIAALFLTAQYQIKVEAGQEGTG